MQQVAFQVKARRTDLEGRLGLKESFANGPSYKSCQNWLPDRYTYRKILHIQKCLTPRALQPFPLLLPVRARTPFNRASPLAIASSEAS
eukprot:7342125-Prymnesium_polylepis.1